MRKSVILLTIDSQHNTSLKMEIEKPYWKWSIAVAHATKTPKIR